MKLKLLPRENYQDIKDFDPIRYYYWPIFGKLYRKRVELCLEECGGGERVLDIGFGSGVNFLNLNDRYEEVYGIDLTAKVNQITEVFDGFGVKTKLINGDVLDMPYPDDHFDTVLLVSILEHLKPEDQIPAMTEIKRVLKPGGQMVYGVPVERAFMVFMFRVLGVNIRGHHFSTELDVSRSGREVFAQDKVIDLKGFFPFDFPVYQVGHFVKEGINKDA